MAKKFKSKSEARTFLNALDAFETIDREERSLREEEATNGNAQWLAHRTADRELGEIDEKLRDSASGHTHRAAQILGGRVHGRLSDTEYQAFRKAINSAVSDSAVR